MSAAHTAANKALILAHYDAVTNGHDPDSIRLQVAADFIDHAAGTAMSVDDMIAHSRALHGMIAISSPRAWCGAVFMPARFRASHPPAGASNFAA